MTTAWLRWTVIFCTIWALAVYALVHPQSVDQGSSMLTDSSALSIQATEDLRTLPRWRDAMSDGCSVPPVAGLTHEKLNLSIRLRAACVEHDHAYYLGGSRERRLAEDWRLGLAWLATGELSALAVEAFVGAVRVGGAPEYRRPGISWGFGGERFRYDPNQALETE